MERMPKPDEVIEVEASLPYGTDHMETLLIPGGEMDSLAEKFRQSPGPLLEASSFPEVTSLHLITCL